MQSNMNGSLTETDYEYVGFWVRVLASLIDTALLLMITAPILTFIYGTGYWIEEGVFVAGSWDILLNWVFPAVAVILFWIYRQATPGKIILGARIVDANTGNPPSAGQLIIRYIGYYPSTIILFLGLFWVGWNKKKQGWHDLMAGTVVIRKKRTCA